MTEFVGEINNPIQQSANKSKYNVNATFTLGNNVPQPVALAFTANPELTQDKNIVLVFNNDAYSGFIDCQKIDDIKGTFIVDDTTYTLNKLKDNLLETNISNYVQLKCGDVLHQFELVDVTKQVASSAVSNAFDKAFAKVASKQGGKHSRKAGKKAGKNASYKVGGRRAKRHTIRRRGTRKK